MQDRAEMMVVRTVNTQFISGVEEECFEGRTRVEERLSELGARLGDPELNTSGHSMGAQVIKVQTQRKPKVGKFSGDFARWREFKSLFVSEVHSNPDLNNLRKLRKLQDACVGDE